MSKINDFLIQNKKLIEDYIDDFNSKKQFSILNSIPIIWFGNMEEYLNSKKKVITISYQPSKIEFTNGFIVSTGISLSMSNPNRVIDLSNKLNSYFATPHVNSWFNYFEKRLEHPKINASYYDIAGKNRAIHMNIYSAIAPKDDAVKEKIKNSDLAKRMVTVLDPDVVLYSASETIREQVFSNYTHEKSESFIGKYCTASGKILLSAPCLSHPFVCMTDDEIKKSLNKLL